jgi:RNA polymerase sigma-70 factor (ECF subfamily)
MALAHAILGHPSPGDLVATSRKQRDPHVGPSDAAVIRQSLDAPDEFAEIFERHHQAIWSFAVARLGREDGSDVASQVFVIAFEQRDRFDFEYESAKPWLYGIAANLIRRRYRSRKRKSAAMERVEVRLEEATDPMEEVDERLDARADLVRVRDALAALSAKDRDIVMMAVMDELSYEEIGAVLGIPIGTVRSRLSRARRRLGELVAASGQSVGEGAQR